MHISQKTPIPLITLHSVGAHSIITKDKAITPDQPRLFAMALYLILERGKSISRDTLRRMFWPDETDPAQAQRASRQVMHRLRDSGFPIPLRTDLIRLPHSFAVADIGALENVAFDKIHDVSFLPDYNPEISPDFVEWLNMHREAAHKKIAGHLLSLARKERVRYNWQLVEKLAALCLQIQPFNDKAVYVRGEAMTMLNDRDGAEEALRSYTRRLPKHLDTLSSQTLLQRLKEKLPEASYPPLRKAPFIGRTEEISELQKFIDLASESAGGGFLLLGNAGVGKSRLLQETHRYALLVGSLVKVIKCQPGDERTPLSVFTSLIPQLKELPGAAGCDGDTKEILRRITVHEPHYVATHHALESETLRLKLKHAIRDLIDAVAHEQVLLLVVEDLQWIDRASAELLNDLIIWSQGRQIGIVLTSRRAYNSCTGLATPSCLTTKTLDSLSIPEAEHLAKEIAYLHGKELDKTYTHDVSRLSGGNPFFLHALIKQWVDTAEKYLTPPSLESILNEQISRINPDALRVLETVALLGRQATRERVDYVLDHKGKELDGVFKELGVAEMVVRQDGIVQSKHDLLTAEVIRRIPGHTRRNLHGKIARVLEAEVQGNPPVSILWDCAEHFDKAEEPEQARRIMMLCGQHTANLGYQKDAADTFARALAYCTDDKDRLALLQVMAVAQNGSGMHGACLQTVAQIRRIAPYCHDEYELLALHSAWKSVENWDKTVAAIRQCLWDESASDEHKLQAATIGLKIASDTGNKYIIEEMHRNVSKELKRSAIAKGVKLEFELIYATMQGSLRRAMQKARELMAITNDRDPIHKQINRRFNCAVPFLRAGKFDIGHSYLEEALVRAEKHHLHRMMVLMASKLIYNYLSNGKPAEARAIYARIDQVKDDLRDEPVTYQFLMRLKEQIALVEADMEGTGPVETGYLPLLDPGAIAGNARLDEMALYVHRSLLQKSRPGDLRNVLEEMAELHKDVRIVGGQDYTTYVLVKGLQAIGKSEQAEKLLREYMEVHRLEKWPVAGKLAGVVGVVGREISSSKFSEAGKS